VVVVVVVVFTMTTSVLAIESVVVVALIVEVDVVYVVAGRVKVTVGVVTYHEHAVDTALLPKAFNWPSMSGDLTTKVGAARFLRGPLRA
jgi:hypothetical protein